jgi:hypothetical protein
MTQCAKELLVANPSCTLHQRLVHQGNMGGSPSEADTTQLQPEA